MSKEVHLSILSIVLSSNVVGSGDGIFWLEHATPMLEFQIKVFKNPLPNNYIQIQQIANHRQHHKIAFIMCSTVGAFKCLVALAYNLYKSNYN